MASKHFTDESRLKRSSTTVSTPSRRWQSDLVCHRAATMSGRHVREADITPLKVLLDNTCAPAPLPQNAKHTPGNRIDPDKVGCS